MPTPLNVANLDEGVSTVDDVAAANVGIESVICRINGQSVDIVANYLGGEILLSGKPSQTRSMLK